MRIVRTFAETASGSKNEQRLEFNTTKSLNTKYSNRNQIRRETKKFRNESSNVGAFEQRLARPR